MIKIVIATSNKGKVGEIKALLAGLDLEVLTLDDFPAIRMPEETGATFRENARLKALYVAHQTGLVSLADDSGLAVDGLDGRPGVRSARYAGDGATDEANYLKLLAELDSVADDERSAQFACAIALARPDGTTVTFEGVLKGRIARSPSGENGFGYDPVFYVKEKGMAVAEMTPVEKNSISHRGTALRKFKDWAEAHLDWFNGL